MGSENSQRAFGSYHALKHILVNKNRYFTKWSPLEMLGEALNSKWSHIETGTIIYRARNIGISDIEKIGKSERFQGFGKKDSFAPPSEEYRLIPDGRMNPKFIRYLYAAEDAQTAIYEVRPTIQSMVSVARIKCTSSIRICDLSSNDLESDTLENDLISLIIEDFSTPIIGNDSETYLTTQYISEYVKNLGFDGIKYKSSLNSCGNNFTIFSLDNCEVISSRIYRVKAINIQSEIMPIIPIHKKVGG